ncbi:flagellar biosynthetic protein FliS [Desulfonatronum thiosulfatophilum]|uniref:Flagellar biosynthetic protein FliS n=1 Tax=Desulfonatronum thiosulfatophilum TaxID=617002 RepID=A0A1G6A6Z6_9BACT|nr:flagellar export chaperone FliS [Desulfonatronum thiosulfatophilum]SDB04241.1 flagellar biosynthetic protein FliS [Desulfonatronum thiosulfatophilum]
MYNAARAYLQTQVTTTNPGDVVVLLYEGAIKFLQQAKIKMAERDMEQKGILISKALDIIAELDASINTQKGGELGENLHKLYFFCNTRLLQANLKLDPKLVDEVITILSGLKSAFEEIKGQNHTPMQSVASEMNSATSPNIAPPTTSPTMSMKYARNAYK